jgi:hypothetical protein
MPSSGMLRRVVLVRTDVSEERSATIIKVTRFKQTLDTNIILHNTHYCIRVNFLPVA